MSRRTTLSRRTVLRGILGGAAVSVGLPLLEVFLNDSHTAYASGDPLPKRFGIFFWGNGNLPDLWVPKGTGTEWELSPTLAPLAPVRPKISVVSGMRVAVTNKIPHYSGPVGMLSGADFVPGTETFALPTIDQVIAGEIGNETRFKSLEVGVQPGSKGLSYNGPHSQNPPESSPFAFFQRVFGPEFVMPGTVAEPNPMLALRQSVLDAVSSDAKKLQGVLGANDKIRLEKHLDGVRALELRLKKLQEDPPSLAACTVPAAPPEAYPDDAGRPQLSAISRAMVDILAMALACDQTRVFSMWFSNPVNNTLFKTATAGHHQLTHDEPNPQPEVAKILLEIMDELAYMLKAFDAVAEGEGTLLDHCAILATTDCSYAKQHLLEDYPIVIAGSANGALKTGVHYRSPANENTSKVLLSLARAMGMTLDGYGQGDAKATQSLSAIEA